MNIEKIFTNFWKLHSEERFSSNGVTFFVYVVMESSRNGWKEIKLPSSVIGYFASLSEAAVNSAREELRRRGLIDFTPGVNGRAVSSYRVIDPTARTGVSPAVKNPKGIGQAGTKGTCPATGAGDVHAGHVSGKPAGTSPQTSAPLPFMDCERPGKTDRR